MQLNLPIYDQLAPYQNILIAGIGGGFDVFAGLPLYFTLRAHGKSVHLANYSFTEFELARIVCHPHTLPDTLVMGACSPVRVPIPYFPEGFLSQWFHEVRGEEVVVWMLAQTGVIPLLKGYRTLIDHLQIEALLLVDGGVDSLMRGDEIGAGTLVEDTISLAAVSQLDLKTKLLACIGFGTEVEEVLCHYSALENIAALAQKGAFLGSCALTGQMEAFRLYEAACRYVWEQPGHAKSHISTRIIPAVHGQFGSYQMYPDDHQHNRAFISPLLNLYWFFDAQAVIERSLLVEALCATYSKNEALMLTAGLRRSLKTRPRRPLPYD